jgi:hypothetical protein
LPASIAARAGVFPFGPVDPSFWAICPPCRGPMSTCARDSMPQVSFEGNSMSPQLTFSSVFATTLLSASVITFQRVLIPIGADIEPDLSNTMSTSGVIPGRRSKRWTPQAGASG